MAEVTWPRIFHRIWLDEPERPEFSAWRDKLAALHPSWEIKTWGDSGELGWMRYADVMQDLLRSDPFGRAPDLLRYELLWRFGGVYIDTDFEPLRPIDGLLSDAEGRPFAAWENDRTICTALLAAPPGHPAIGILLDGVVEQLKATEGRPANEALGPEYATWHWRHRDDVRRLPPWTFYPVGWWEKQLLGGPYPAETYAVHHWAKGWASDSKPGPRRTAATTSILVAFRDDQGTRREVWEFIRAKLEAEVEAEIVVASDDGEDPFHKTKALNRAAEKATGEIFAIWDADTWVQADAIAEAIEFVAQSGRWARPWNVKVKANEKATRHVLDLGATWDGTLDHRWFGQPENRNTFSHAPPLILTRESFMAVGAFDERFRGWGQEDVAFSLALRRLVGPQKAFRHQALHLWHPRRGKSGKDLWDGQASEADNLRLVRDYQQARTPDAMRKLIEARRAVAV